jgi:hypothetical protein
MVQHIIVAIILIVVFIMQLLERCVTSLGDTLLQYCARQYWYTLWWTVKCSIVCQCLKWRSSAGPVITLSFSDFIFMDPCIVDDSIEIPTRCSFVIEFIITKFIDGSTCFEQHTAHYQEL